MNIIVSADMNWGIGKDKRLLFWIPPDMRFFQEKTIGGAVIMGRKTLESLPGGKPLEDRVNIVMTRNPGLLESKPREINGFPDTGSDNRLIICRDVRDLAARLKALAFDRDRVWVIGGAEIYRLLLPYSKEAFVTRVLTEAPQVDYRMVNLDEAEGWARIETGDVREWEGLRYRFDRYENINLFLDAEKTI